MAKGKGGNPYHDALGRFASSEGFAVGKEVAKGAAKGAGKGALKGAKWGAAVGGISGAVLGGGAAVRAGGSPLGIVAGAVSGGVAGAIANSARGGVSGGVSGAFSGGATASFKRHDARIKKEKAEALRTGRPVKNGGYWESTQGKIARVAIQAATDVGGYYVGEKVGARAASTNLVQKAAIAAGNAAGAKAKQYGRSYFSDQDRGRGGARTSSTGSARPADPYFRRIFDLEAKGTDVRGTSLAERMSFMRKANAMRSARMLPSPKRK